MYKIPVVILFTRFEDGFRVYMLIFLDIGVIVGETDDVVVVVPT
jgi:hypothetical protein